MLKINYNSTDSVNEIKHYGASKASEKYTPIAQPEHEEISNVYKKKKLAWPRMDRIALMLEPRVS